MKQNEQMRTLSLEVLRFARNSLLMHLRFLDAALSRFVPYAHDSIPFGTDGKYLVYHPKIILKRYAEGQQQLTYWYLHSLIHCVFRHPFVNAALDHRLWNLACDIAVAHIISGLNVDIVAYPNRREKEQVYSELTKQIKLLTAEHLYRHFLESKPSGRELLRLESLFQVDDHRLWYMTDAEKHADGIAAEQENLPKASDEASEDASMQETTVAGEDVLDGVAYLSPSDNAAVNGMHFDTDASDAETSESIDADSPAEKHADGIAAEQGNPPKASDEAPEDASMQKTTVAGEDMPDDVAYRSPSDNAAVNGIPFDTDANDAETSESIDADSPEPGDTPPLNSPEDWKGIAERMLVDLETFSQMQGDEAGRLMQALHELNRERYDYTAFLKKFAVLGEEMLVNDDEFDYIFYTYGLRLYRNMPLIEPLEYKEIKRIREFVIAIDTSGSVAGEQVQAFLQKTYNIMQQTDSFFSKINLHMIQCDAKIQEHVKITSQEECDEYLAHMQIQGLGGTDFRPVFRLVDSLCKAGEFTNLKGLIYFTDGCGTFPERKPFYETAFIFVEEYFDDYVVPPWAIKLILRKDEL